MSVTTTTDKSWAPPPDEELTWFLPDEKLFARPRPLDYAVEVHAIVFGLTYALESLEFPLYAFRSRLVNGRLYLAVVPSASAERDLPHRLRDINDLSLRFTRNIRQSWDKQIMPEVKKYNRSFDALASFSGSSEELSEKVRQLRRARGNQWFTAIRGAVAPTVLLQRTNKGVGADALADAEMVTREALEMVAGHSGEVVASALNNVGERLVATGSLDKAEDIFWLEWLEVRNFLQAGGDCRTLVAARKADAARSSQLAAPDKIGPPLAADAPRMHLVPQVLNLLAKYGR